MREDENRLTCEQSETPAGISERLAANPRVWRVQNPRGGLMLDWTTLFTNHPFGGGLVLFAGLAIVGIAIFYSASNKTPDF